MEGRHERMQWLRPYETVWLGKSGLHFYCVDALIESVLAKYMTSTCVHSVKTDGTRQLERFHGKLATDSMNQSILTWFAALAIMAGHDELREATQNSRMQTRRNRVIARCCKR